MKERNKSDHWRNFLKKNCINYKNINSSRSQSINNVSKFPNPEIKSIISKPPKIETKLAPNRYTVKGMNLSDLINKQTGSKGPYSCFTVERKPETIIGHLALPKFKGSNTLFYNLPDTNRLNHPRNDFIMKIRESPIKPLFYKDPSDPAPNHYNPKNYCMGAFKSSQKNLKSATQNFYKFYPMTTVPETENIFTNNKSLQPGPGRYNPDIIGCPCKRGCLYDPDLIQELEKEKRLRLRRKLFKYNINTEKLCYSGNTRNIKGHGHTSIFNSKSKRLVKTSISMGKITKADKHVSLYHDTKYIQMICNPRRDQISFSLTDEITPQIKSLRFNTIERPKMRCKLRMNRKIAFMASQPRFKDLEDDYTPDVDDIPKKFKRKSLYRIFFLCCLYTAKTTSFSFI